MQNLSWPQNYVGRIFLLCFVGTHIPLLGLIALVLLKSEGTPLDLYWILGVALAGTLVATGFTFYAVACMLQPVLKATEALDRYVGQGVKPDLPVAYADEAGRLMASVQCTVLKLGSAIEELTLISITDPLTGARNRRWLNDIGIPDYQRLRSSGAPYSLLTVDLDNFKSINDTHGHTAGDQVLMAVSDAIRQSIRAGDQVVRTGGDEFCVLLPGTDRSRLGEVADRIRSSIAEVTSVMSPEFAVTLSIGGATSRDQHASFADLYRRADANLYEAKHNGRDRAVTA
jgi:diguanylate cyclase (GGDEF)-like protein